MLLYLLTYMYMLNMYCVCRCMEEANLPFTYKSLRLLAKELYRRRTIHRSVSQEPLFATHW